MSEPSLSQELAALKARITELEDALAASLQLNEYYRQQLFGKKSERYDPSQENLDFGEEVLGKPEPSADSKEDDQEGEEDAKPKRKGQRTRRRKEQLFPRSLKSIIVEESIPDEVKANPEDYRQIEVREHRELEITRAAIYWRVTRTPKFVRKDDKQAAPISQPAPHPTVPGTLCGPTLISQIICDKYCDHLPHYRQSQRFLRRHDIELQRGTINQWTAAFAQHLAPIGQAIKDELLDTDALQIDESPGKYLQPGSGQTQTGYWWAYRNVHTSTVYFDWQTNRATSCLYNILGYDEGSNTLAYTGLIHCDGYQAYDALAKEFAHLILAGCHAHLRRKFFEARHQQPEHTLPILQTIRNLYQIDREIILGESPPGCQNLIRRSRSLPEFEKLKTQIEQAARTNPLPSSKLGKAITYARNQWEKLKETLLHPELDLDTNRIENKIRPLKLGLKNYLFLGSAEAGVNNALLYTLIENCKVQGLDPEAYFEEVLEALRTPLFNEEEIATRAASLTPAAIAASKAASKSEVEAKTA